MIFTHQNIHSKPTKKVGFVVKTHGFNGEIKINYSENPIFEKKYIMVSINNKFVPFKISSQKNNFEILKLETVKNIDEANELIGCELLIFKDTEETDEISWEDYVLIDSFSQNKYQITKFIENPGNDLLEFRDGYKDYLIPFIQDLISQINHQKKEITMNFPDGILEL